jgi:hypothetical protein
MKLPPIFGVCMSIIVTLHLSQNSYLGKEGEAQRFWAFGGPSKRLVEPGREDESADILDFPSSFFPMHNILLQRAVAS